MKPDNFPFSEEVYQEIEFLRQTVTGKKFPLNEHGVKVRPPELDARLVAVSVYVLTKEYDKFMSEQFDKSVIGYSHTETK